MTSMTGKYSLFVDMVRDRMNIFPIAGCRNSTYPIYWKTAKITESRTWEMAFEKSMFGMFDENLRRLWVLLVLSIWLAICQHPNYSIPLVPTQNRTLWPHNFPILAHFWRPNHDEQPFYIPNIPFPSKCHYSEQIKCAIGLNWVKNWLSLRQERGKAVFGNLLCKIDLILFGNVLSATRTQIVNQWTFAHVLGHQINMLAIKY